MKILFLGDIVGNSGCQAIKDNLPNIIKNKKIDFVVELLPYHLNDSNIPNELSEVVYKYDIGSGRWRFNLVLAGQKKFIPTEKGWKIVT